MRRVRMVIMGMLLTTCRSEPPRGTGADQLASSGAVPAPGSPVAASAQRPSAVDTHLLVYPPGYVLPEYTGDRFRRIWSDYALTADGRVHGVDRGYYEYPALRGSVARNRSGECALWPGGVVKCWTSCNLSGQAGPGCRFGDRCENPVRVPLPEPVSILGGYFGTYCALSVGGRLHCWGDNTEYQAHPSNGKPCREDPGQIRRCPIPILIDLPPASHLDYGHHVCVVTREGGHVYCWGRGALTQWTSGKPERQEGVSGVSQVIQLRGYAMYLLMRDGTVLARGGNSLGDLGEGTTARAKTFQPIPGLRNVKQVSPESCALQQGGTVSCWGSSAYRYERRPDGKLAALPGGRPFRVPGIEGAVQIASLGGLICARWEEGRVYCWGRRNEDELGPSEKRELVPPVPLHAATVQKALLPPKMPYLKPKPGTLCFDLERAEHECDEKDVPLCDR